MAKKKNYSRMNVAELRKATKDLDEDFAFETTKKLGVKGVREHVIAAARRRGRPKKCANVNQ
jgi:Arc/MetJ family transcription regulator